VSDLTSNQERAAFHGVAMNRAYTTPVRIQAALQALEMYEAEVEQLRQENARLRDELERWTSGRRRKGLPVVESVPDGLQYAAALVRAQGTEGGEEHDTLLREAGMRLKAIHDAASHLLAEREIDKDPDA